MSRVSELIKKLIEHWTCWDEHEVFYLTQLAPRLVIDPQSGDEKEQAILAALRPLLSETEWNELPRMIAEQRDRILREVESERLRREAQERERLEAARTQRETRERRTAMLSELRVRFNRDFLSAEPYFLENCAGILSEQEFETEKCTFVKGWLRKNGPNQLQDDEQIAAVAATHGHIQVVARAGSGKTTTTPGQE